MHLIETHEGPKAAKAAAEGVPFGPGFPNIIAERTVKLEVWGSSFSDPGPDFCEFKAFDVAGAVVGHRRVNGY